MASSGDVRSLIRFGAFEADLDTEELRKHGLRIKLQDQPFQILALLLEHPGQVVTREELQQRLWPADTFVDFDRGLNKAINRLRDALGDSADQPRFIETLPKRGYRFVGSIESAQSANRTTPQRSNNLSRSPARRWPLKENRGRCGSLCSRLSRWLWQSFGCLFANGPCSPKPILWCWRILKIEPAIRLSISLSGRHLQWI